MSTLVAEVDDVRWLDAWTEALDAIELDVCAAEDLLRTAHLTPVEEVAAASVWHPPTALGPLPAALHVRASAILERQLDVARRTAEALAYSRRHLAAADLARPRPLETPVYVDEQA
ncbi:hypothetical protein Cch01nite_33370 [Cellulomonas chitinilytica]|uniref:Uncharacterized protein n=1 Tax=Cellulomonas chitinilytica TaxID=398759 RepID=A0A919U122_9CELL|nr:hypothetical protein [Cellulomonas chitinilytica]GIG22613.1 hypothetical protein Cch01nite_33370 [Cellulomonas chitinilytica]